MFNSPSLHQLQINRTATFNALFYTYKLFYCSREFT